MVAATAIAIFIIPMLFAAVERWSGAEKKRTAGGTETLPGSPGGATAPAGRER